VPASRPADRQPLLLFLEDLFDDVYLQVALGQEPLETSVLFFEFADAGRFVCAHAAEVSAPAIEGVLRNVVLAADLGDRAIALLGLLQNGDDLCV